LRLAVADQAHRGRRRFFLGCDFYSRETVDVEADFLGHGVDPLCWPDEDRTDDVLLGGIYGAGQRVLLAWPDDRRRDRRNTLRLRDQPLVFLVPLCRSGHRHIHRVGGVGGGVNSVGSQDLILLANGTA